MSDGPSSEATTEATPVADSATVEATEATKTEAPAAAETVVEEEVKPEEDKDDKDDIDLEALATSWKNRSRTHEKRVKELVKEKDDWEKTRLTLEADLHKTQTELEAFKKEAHEAKVNSLRAAAADEYKLPANALKFLRETDEEAIKKEAAELAETFGTAKTAASSSKLSISTQGLGLSDTNTADPFEALRVWQAQNLNK